jgi:hypothetical protein
LGILNAVNDYHQGGMMDLFKRTVPKNHLSELSQLIHGFPKTGKSTYAAQHAVDGKEPLFIATEDGHHTLNVLCERITNWTEFKELVMKIEKNKDVIKKQISCLVLDLVSDLDQFCADYVCKQLHIKNLADLDFGKGFSTHKKEFQAEIAKLFSILPITFIAHSKEKEITFEGEKIKLQAPNLSNGCLEYINGKVDLLGFIVPSAKTKANPLITFRPSKLAIAGTRFAHMAKEFELNPLSMNDSYKAINQAFTNK